MLMGTAWQMGVASRLGERRPGPPDPLLLPDGHVLDAGVTDQVQGRAVIQLDLTRRGILGRHGLDDLRPLSVDMQHVGPLLLAGGQGAASPWRTAPPAGQRQRL